MKFNALNFSGGPGALPETVLAQTRDAIVALPDTGMSVLGMSHRSEWFRSVLEEAEMNIRHLLGLSSDYAITFLQGGSSLLFATIPMNFTARAAAAPEYVTSGYWSAKATAEAAKVTKRNIVWDGKITGYRQLPDLRTLDVAPSAAYLHYVSNETVEGLQFDPCDVGDIAAPLIADMSSDFLSKPFRSDAYSMIYAHAQKNLGPAGVTVAVIRRSLLDRIPDGLPAILDFRTHVLHSSNYNTPPVFAIYVLMLVTRWLRFDIGGLHAMQRINEEKSKRLYATLDALGDAVTIHADPRWRSQMNVSFTFGDKRLDQAFIAAARDHSIVGLEGHRSVGGLRASLYNAVTEEAVESLCLALNEFAVQHV
ncbi:3-phosphoserine/phosphohydroxythreonine transaminase [Paraburkholderia sp. SARCC-3016]|uniref:3-phosphoserine/phosphohydroxythreonine transaminase n=1 Tax=Paraburkholderia sp. SARCC-3016 TaxID=3058611 RepID=UPI00280A3327|nr:3-phosphoserine/phosphohydroxythreonine transaminase [Paraburkholderia sp. SARCC-3016]MDQ7975728.1 3-phosphoserine/phosphohydroxythreonine transaminase [Paraburkholderia sp. SARCC-3016]